jgi:hypothetical protein
VRERHCRADDQSIPRPPLPTGDVGRHHGLAVPGKRGVPGAEPERQDDREHAHERGEVAADEAL